MSLLRLQIVLPSHQLCSCCYSFSIDSGTARPRSVMMQVVTMKHIMPGWQTLNRPRAYRQTTRKVTSRSVCLRTPQAAANQADLWRDRRPEHWSSSSLSCSSITLADSFRQTIRYWPSHSFVFLLQLLSVPIRDRRAASRMREGTVAAQKTEGQYAGTYRLLSCWCRRRGSRSNKRLVLVKHVMRSRR